MKPYKFTNINDFENEIDKVTKNETQLIVETSAEDYEEIKEKILDNCYYAEDFDKEKNLLIVKWTKVSIKPIKKIKKDLNK